MEVVTPTTQSVVGRLAARAWLPGDDLPEVGSRALVSGANADVESDQHRSFSWCTVVGYGADDGFICLQTEGCWRTIERTTNCWFAEIEKPRAIAALSSLAGGEELRRIAAALQAYADGCVEARSWGGPTMYPPHPADEETSRQWSKQILAALSPEAPAREGVAELSDALDLWIVDGLKKAERRIMEIKPSGCDGMSSDDVESGRVSAYQLGFQNGVKSTLTDASFVIMNAATDSDKTRGAIKEACDLLAERTYGNPARSPGHNARLVLEAALTPRHEAPADHHERNLTARNTELIEQALSHPPLEAPAEGAGEAWTSLIKDLRMAGCGLFNLKNDRGDYGYFDTIADRIEALRARPSAPEAREGYAVDDRLHSAIEKLKAHVVAIQAGKRNLSSVINGPNPILSCVNELPAIIRQLDAAELEIEAAFERHEDHPAAPSADKLRIAVEALEPFAREAERIRAPYSAETIMDNVDLWQCGSVEITRTRLTYGDLRRAAKALAALKAEGAK